MKSPPREPSLWKLTCLVLVLDAGLRATGKYLRHRRRNHLSSPLPDLHSRRRRRRRRRQQQQVRTLITGMYVST